MVINLNFRSFFIFISLICSLSTISANFVGKLWSYCTVNNALTGYYVYNQAKQLTYDEQLQLYTDWDGSRKGNKANYSGENVSLQVKKNIEKIAQELNIDISALKIKKMTNPRKCLTTLGIEVTSNFIFVQEEEDLWDKPDNSLFSLSDEQGYRVQTVRKLINFGDQQNQVASFFIKQVLLQYQRSFYTKKIVHQIGLGLASGIATSYVHQFCTNCVGSVFNPEFQNPVAQFMFATTKFVGKVGLSALLHIAAQKVATKYKSIISDYIYHDIISCLGVLDIDELLNDLQVLKNGITHYQSRVRLLEKQISNLNKIKADLESRLVTISEQTT